MKQVSKLSLIALSILMASCNEKVSPELEKSNSTTPTSSATNEPPTEYYFQINNTSSTLLNYKLHKTGPGNYNKACEVRNTTGLSNDNFRGAQSANDISCFFEAEELSMFHGGFSFEIKASKNTCDYVAYSPYGFFDRIPGSSSATYYKVACEGPVDSGDIAASTGGLDLRDNTGSVIGCNEYVIDGAIIPQATRRRFTISEEQRLCAFNYTSRGGSNCDIGEITINELKVTVTPDQAGGPDVVTPEWSTRNIDCGGKVESCVAGPTKLLNEDFASYTEITSTTPGQEVSVPYSYDGLIGKNTSLKFYANYRRDLASKHIDYVTADNLTSNYKNIWGDATYGKVFDSSVMDFFSGNLMMDNVTPIISYTRLETEAVRSDTYYRKPLAADPFLGIFYRVNPFYTFYCLDTAMDIKARIRMVVREWDRIYPTGSSESNIEFLSDLHLLASGRQDAPYYVEVPDDNDRFVYFNDLQDWDDKIPMTRTSGAFSPVGTIWAPVGTPTYVDGWFNPNYFTNGAY
jgi:hypothetical protein